MKTKTLQKDAENTKSGDKNLYDLVPVQKAGKQLDLSERVDAGHAKSAAELFSRAKEKLMTPSLWTGLAAIPGTEFTGIKKESFDVINGKTSIGDFIRIGIPGPEPSEGGGYDFVQIEKLDGFEDEDRVLCGVVMQVRPCPNPQLNDPADADEQNTAHFFESDATSSFIITQEHNFVRAEYFGRNEKINRNEESGKDDLRNTLVGAGAKIGFSRIQWDSFLKGLLAS